MQQIIPVFLMAVFLVIAVRQILYWSWLWQLKEYRIDRLRAHFYDIGARDSFLALIGYTPISHGQKPKITVKASLVSFCSFLICVLIPALLYKYFLEEIFGLFDRIGGSYALDEYYITIIFFALFLAITPLIVFINVEIFNFIGNFQKKWIIMKARKKIASLKNLTVIGVTGSYGKSTTKEIIFEILSRSQNFFAPGGNEKIIRTPANINTPIGIARLILDSLNKNHEIFIVEMGAYNAGEIKEICKIVKPKIGIITAINEQHLALFGSIKNTIKAKFELFDCLPDYGLAVLNVDDKNIQAGLEERKEAKMKIKLYSIEAKSDVYATDIAVRSQSVYFKMVSGVEIHEFKINLIGKHGIGNALPAIIAANYLGISLEEISQILQRIGQMSYTLKISTGPNGSALFNDTYNSNPDGVLADLAYLKNQRGGKVVVMSSLIELGSAGREVHRKIGNEISKISKKVFFLDKYYLADITNGIKNGTDFDVEIKYEGNINKVADYLKNELKSSDQVLFVGRKAGKVLEFLTR